MSDKFIICDGTDKTFCVPKCSNVSAPSNPQAIFSADFSRAKAEFCVLVKPHKINPGRIQIFHEMPIEKLPGCKPQCVWGLLGFIKQTNKQKGTGGYILSHYSAWWSCRSWRLLRLHYPSRNGLVFVMTCCGYGWLHTAGSEDCDFWHLSTIFGL